MNTLRLFYISLTLACYTPTLFAQGTLHQAINPTGGEAIGAQGSASFSIGQLVYSSFENTNLQVAGGVQQAALDDPQTFKIDNDRTGITITAYPNPVIDHLILTIKNADLKNVAYQLFDVHGRLVKKEHLYRAQTTIALDHLQPATYLLKVLHKNKTLQVLKLVKS